MFSKYLFVTCVWWLYLSQAAECDEGSPTSPATVEQIHQSVERAIPYLEKESDSWLKSRGCAAGQQAFALPASNSLLPPMQFGA